MLTVRVALHALPNQVISPWLILTAVMTQAHMTPYQPLICFLSTEQENVIPHIPERSLCSLRMTFNLSLHQSTSGRERSGGTRGGGGGVHSHTHAHPQRAGLACWRAKKTHRTGSVLFCWTLFVFESVTVRN